MLGTIIVCHILALIILPRLVPADLPDPLAEPSLVAVDARFLPERPLEEVVLRPPEELPDPTERGGAGSRSRQSTVFVRRDDLPPHVVSPQPEPLIRLNTLEVASGSAAPELDIARLAELAGPVRGLGEGNGNGQGIGDGTGTGRQGDGVGAFDPSRNVKWAPQWNRSVIQNRMPSAARRQRMRGLVVLECTALRGDHVNACEIIEEHPGGYGFGQAALDAEQLYLLHVTDASDNRIYDVRIRFYIDFRVR